MKTRKILTAIICLLILTTLAFIWGNSLAPKSESQSMSLGVLETLKPFLAFFVGEGNVTDHLVRKIAHFSEFAALGGELVLLLILRRKKGLQPIVNCLFAGLAVAVTDEALQMLIPGRGPLVADVLLDFCGFSCGLFIIIGPYFVIKKRR